jgi:hypothetical protein
VLHLNRKALYWHLQLESLLVSNPYGTIGKELEVEATVKGVGNKFARLR